MYLYRVIIFLFFSFLALSVKFSVPCMPLGKGKKKRDRVLFSYHVQSVSKHFLALDDCAAFASCNGHLFFCVFNVCARKVEIMISRVLYFMHLVNSFVNSFLSFP